jgi:hypothetical protein
MPMPAGGDGRRVVGQLVLSLALQAVWDQQLLRQQQRDQPLYWRALLLSFGCWQVVLWATCTLFARLDGYLTAGVAPPPLLGALGKLQLCPQQAWASPRGKRTEPPIRTKLPCALRNMLMVLLGAGHQSEPSCRPPTNCL